MSRRPLRSSWTKDARGVAAVEFALIAPVLLTLLLTGYETFFALSTYRKLTDTTVQLANVVSQYTTMSATDVTTVFNATSQIMAPYSTNHLSIVLSEVTADASGNPTVTWSRAYNGATPLATGSSVVMPTGLAAPSTSYILVRSAYTYIPAGAPGFVGNIPMADQLFALPRQSTSIPYTG